MPGKPDPWERAGQISVLTLPSLDAPRTTGLRLRISLFHLKHIERRKRERGDVGHRRERNYPNHEEAILDPLCSPPTVEPRLLVHLLCIP